MRELENVIERAITITDDEIIGTDDLPDDVKNKIQRIEQSASPYFAELTLFDVEKLHIENVLKAADGNKSKASRILGIDYSTLLRKLKSMDIEV